MNPDKLLTMLIGKCWHEPKSPKTAYSNCIHCGIEMLHWPDPIGWKPRDEDENEPNPSFSDPRHRDEFFTWLCRERGEMWFQFKHYAYSAWIDDADSDELISWLFFSDPSRPRDLMAEWLRLDETIKRFGWEERYCDHCRKGDVQMHYTHPCEKCGAIGGRILSAWAKYAKEGE